jgi:hypothetical protein
MLPLALFAQNKPTGSPFERPEIIWASAALAGALLVGAVVIYLVDKWRKRAAMADREAGLELTDFRAMFERGEITEAEYNKLRLKVAGRVKNAAAAAPPAAGPAAPPHPPFAGPFPAGYFDGPTTSPPGNSSPPKPPGGTAPSA